MNTSFKIPKKTRQHLPLALDKNKQLKNLNWDLNKNESR